MVGLAGGALYVSYRSGDWSGGVQVIAVAIIPVMAAGGWLPLGPAMFVWMMVASIASWIVWSGRW